MKFRLGDRVRLVHPFFKDLIGTVTGLHWTRVQVKWDVSPKNEIPMSYMATELEELNEAQQTKVP